MNFILPKSMHLCMIRVVDNTNIDGGKHGATHGKHQGRYGKHEAYFTQVFEGGEGGRSTRMWRGKHYCCLGKQHGGTILGVLLGLGEDMRVHMTELMFGLVCNKLVEPNQVGIG